MKKCLLFVLLGVYLFNLSAGVKYYVNARPVAPTTVKMAPCPSPRHAWVDGYWVWDPGQARYEWVPGSWWMPPGKHTIWVSGHWKRSANGWYWVDGHWKK